MAIGTRASDRRPCTAGSSATRCSGSWPGTCSARPTPVQVGRGPGHAGPRPPWRSRCGGSNPSCRSRWWPSAASAGPSCPTALDLDVLFVFDGAGSRRGNAEAERLASGLRRARSGGSSPAHRMLAVDADLRPEGRQGPLARSLVGFHAYHDRWALTWERQAMTKSTAGGRRPLPRPGPRRPPRALRVASPPATTTSGRSAA